MKHKFLITIDAEASKSEAAAYIRDAVRSMGGCHNPDESPFFGLKSKAVSVRSVKGWNGTHKPAKVSVRWVKKVQALRVYVSGRDLGHVFNTVKDARKFLRSRHPSLAKSADYSRACPTNSV